MKLLMENWRKFLNEDLSNDTYAVYADTEGSYKKIFVLYNISLLEKYLDDFRSGKINSIEYLLIDTGALSAMVKIMETEENCWGAWQIIRSASNPVTKGQKLGFLLYKLVAAAVYPKPITGDRSGTSKSATKVYSKLPADTKDFDDIAHPKTPEPEDDCEIHHDTINKAYFLNKDEANNMYMKLKTLQQNHENFVTSKNENGINLNNFKNLGQHMFERLLLKSAEGVFNRSYKGSDG